MAAIRPRVRYVGKVNTCTCAHHIVQSMHRAQIFAEQSGPSIDLPGCLVMWTWTLHHWLSMPNAMGVAASGKFHGVLQWIRPSYKGIHARKIVGITVKE